MRTNKNWKPVNSFSVLIIIFLFFFSQARLFNSISSFKFFSVPLSSSLFSERCKPTSRGVHPPSLLGLSSIEPFLRLVHYTTLIWKYWTEFSLLHFTEMFIIHSNTLDILIYNCTTLICIEVGSELPEVLKKY